jgi:hypothetical protein
LSAVQDQVTGRTYRQKRAHLPLSLCWRTCQPDAAERGDAGVQRRARASMNPDRASNNLGHALLEHNDVVVEEGEPRCVVHRMDRRLPPKVRNEPALLDQADPSDVAQGERVVVWSADRRPLDAGPQKNHLALVGVVRMRSYGHGRPAEVIAQQHCLWRVGLPPDI